MSNTSSSGKSNYFLLSNVLDRIYRIVNTNGALVTDFSCSSIQDALRFFEHFKDNYKEAYNKQMDSGVGYKKNKLVVHSLVKRIFYSINSLQVVENSYYDVKANGETIKSIFSNITDEEAFVQYNNIMSQYLNEENEPSNNEENIKIYFLIA